MLPRNMVVHASVVTSVMDATFEWRIRTGLLREKP